MKKVHVNNDNFFFFNSPQNIAFLELMNYFTYKLKTNSSDFTSSIAVFKKF